jgi:PAS domain S-box-containing protein
VGVNIDHTEGTQAEERLRASERRLSIAKAAAGLGIHDYDVTTGLIEWDERTRELWGAHAAEAITYETFKAGVHPDDLLSVQNAVDQALDPAGDGAYYAEYRVIHRTDGQTRWIADTGKAFFHEGRRPVRLVGSVQDISERKHAQAVLAREIAAMTRLQKLGELYVREDDFELVLSEIVDAAIAITDADFGNIQLVEPESGDLRIVEQRGFPQWWIDFWNTVSRGRGACGTALARGERVLVADVEQDPIFVGTPSLDVQRKAGVRAVQSTPLVRRSGKPLGMFSTHYQTPRRPDERALKMLDLLARQAADIIDRAQAEEILRRQAQMLRLSSTRSLSGGWAEPLKAGTGAPKSFTASPRPRPSDASRTTCCKPSRRLGPRLKRSCGTPAAGKANCATAPRTAAKWSFPRENRWFPAPAAPPE